MTSTSKSDYWENLNQWFSFALHQLVYIPACCIHAIEQELRTNHNNPPILHRPAAHSETQVVNHFGTAKNSKDHGEKSAIDSQSHLCRGCGEDIITRVHTAHAHEHTRLDNDKFHGWLSNEQPTLDLYEDLPHVSPFEQNLEGFKEEHLERIEKYWAEHQLVSPNCVATAKLATAADWEKTKRLAIENNEQLQSQ